MAKLSIRDADLIREIDQLVEAERQRYPGRRPSREAKACELLWKQVRARRPRRARVRQSEAG